MRIDNRKPTDSWFVNETRMPVTVACNQQQAGKFSVNLSPSGRARVSSNIDAGPCPHMKPSYSDLPYGIGVCEEWAIWEESGQLTMVKVGSADFAELRRQGLSHGALMSRLEEWQGSRTGT